MSLPKRRNEIEVLPRIADGLGDNTKTISVSSTAEQLTTTATDCFWVLITADGSNAGNVWVGSSTITNNRGKQLVQLQDLLISIDDLSKIYVWGAAGDKVHYLYGTCQA